MAIDWLRLGDGEVLLACADVLTAIPSIPEGTIDGVVTDPPYSSGGAFRGDRVASTVSKYVQTTSVDTCRTDFSGDNRDQRSFLAWSALWLCACHHAASDGAVLCSFIDWRQLPVLTDAVQAGGWIWRGIGTWWKPGIRMQAGRFSASSEFVVYASRGKPHAGECSPQNVVAMQPIAGERKRHLAEKPEAVIDWALSVTRRGATILDPFMGSGTTGVCCIRSGRKFVGIERDRKAFDGAVRRIVREFEQRPIRRAAKRLRSLGRGGGGGG